MIRRPPLPALALSVLVVLAGCNALVGTDATESTPASDSTADPTVTRERVSTPTPSATEAGPNRTRPPTATERASTPTRRGRRDPASVVGESAPVEVYGNLSVNATRVYRRVEALLNVSADAPVVRVVENDGSPRRIRPTRVQRALGFGDEVGDYRTCAPIGRARANEYQVRIDPRNLSTGGVELVLVHEFVHTLQGEVDGYRESYPNLPWAISRSMIEGSAVYVTETYARRYDERWAGKRPLEVRECLYRRTENRLQLIAAQYYFGGRYFAGRIDSPRNLSAVFRSPPRTSEQLVHGEAPATEPASPLSVRLSTDDHRIWPRQSGGELLVRTWLSGTLPDSRVETAATGWGNDTIVVSPASDRDGDVAWVLRWDSVADADEFVAAVDALESELEAGNATSLRSARVSPETVVVFAGSERWVENATARGSNGNVTISFRRTDAGTTDDR